MKSTRRSKKSQPVLQSNSSAEGSGLKLVSDAPDRAIPNTKRRIHKRTQEYTRGHKSTQENTRALKSTQVSTETRLKTAIERNLPADARDAPSALFWFMREVKGIFGSELETGLARKIFLKWWDQAQYTPKIADRTPLEIRFLELRKIVKHASNPDFIEDMRAIIQDMPDQEWMYDHAEPMKRLGKLCAALQAASDNNPFYLSCRMAATIIREGIPYNVAAKMIKFLVEEGLLIVTDGHTRRKATCYRWTGER